MGDSTTAGTPPPASRRGPGRLAVLAAVVLALAVTGLILLTTGGRKSSVGSPATSVDPSGFELPALTRSGQVKLSDFAGRPLVVNFFASWCTACRGELAGFRQVRSTLGDTVAFLGVNSLETGDGPGFARQEQIEAWPLARDVGGTQDSGLHDALGGQGLPITAFYDARGKLQKVHLGALSEDGLRELLRGLDHVG